MRVFVSYTSKDPAVTSEQLEKVEARLKPFCSSFIDLLHNEKGKQCRVDRELRRCDVVLQLASPKYQSEWVQKELITARKKNKPVIRVGINELLEMEDEQLYLMLSDVDKKGWSVWGILTVALLICLGISVLGIWLSYLYVGKQSVGSDVMTARGVFGDSWGGVNAIISAFAFAGVIVTLFLQNRDLNLQRKEMARQREEFEKENETLKQQRFENLFYNMLNLQQEIVAGLRYEYKEEEYVLVPSGIDASPVQDKRKVNRVVTGREVFRYTFERAEIYLAERDQYNQRIVVNGYREFLNAKGLSEYDETWIPTIFDHYFRHLYKIIQFVDNQGFSFSEAYRYVALLRGTLSRYELVWVYYNALNPVFHKFQELIEKYSLLKNMRADLLTRSKELLTYYEGLHLTLQDVNDATFTTRDFEYYLTDDKQDAEKYYITAFWKEEEKEEGLELLKKWRMFVEDAAGKV
jgi:hypothetical protein